MAGWADHRWVGTSLAVVPSPVSHIQLDRRAAELAHIELGMAGAEEPAGILTGMLEPGVQSHTWKGMLVVVSVYLDSPVGRQVVAECRTERDIVAVAVGPVERTVDSRRVGRVGRTDWRTTLNR